MLVLPQWRAASTCRESRSRRFAAADCAARRAASARELEACRGGAAAGTAGVGGAGGARPRELLRPSRSAGR